LTLADVKPEFIASDYAESAQMLGDAYLKRLAGMVGSMWIPVGFCISTVMR